MELLAFWILLIISAPLGTFESVSFTPSFKSKYPSLVLKLFKYMLTPPTFSEIDMLLSFKTIINFVLALPALLSAS